jgi:hypothetical protein
MVAPGVASRVAQEVQSTMLLPAGASGPTGLGATPVPGCDLGALGSMCNPTIVCFFPLISHRRSIEWLVNYIFWLLLWVSVRVLQGPRGNTE